MNNKVVNYIMYALIALVIIVGIIFLTSGDNNQSTDPVITEDLVVTTNVINVSVGETSQIGISTQNLLMVIVLIQMIYLNLQLK